jgi:hypothetical protein
MCVCVCVCENCYVFDLLINIFLDQKKKKKSVRTHLDVFHILMQTLRTYGLHMLLLPIKLRLFLVHSYIYIYIYFFAQKKKNKKICTYPSICVSYLDADVTDNMLLLPIKLRLLLVHSYINIYIYILNCCFKNHL